MNLNLFASVSLLLFCVIGDKPQSGTARAVADAEYAFARLSRNVSTVKAFQTFLADDAVLFKKAEAVNGKKLWDERTPDSTLLNWWPVVADASHDGDLGYTTGPYQYFSSRDDKTPKGNGFYSTVWQKQKNGEWKIKIDLGIVLESIQRLPTELTLETNPRNAAVNDSKISAVDDAYNRELNAKSVSFDRNFLSKHFRIHRPLIGPSINETTVVKKTEAGIAFNFQMIDAEESSSHDLAYAYGEVIKSKSNGEVKANYLRVWKVENGKWRIVLDVITGG
jgi:ketosteroid isomerase-like protein